VVLNRIYLKEEILDLFQKYRIQEQFDGSHIFIFLEGMRKLSQNTYSQPPTGDIDTEIR